MKRVKRDMTHRAYKLGYNQGIKGHNKETCPYFETDKRAQWLGGWRDGHVDYVAGYRTAS